MKAIHLLAYLVCSLIFLTLQNCKKSDPTPVPPAPDPEVNFITTTQSIIEGHDPLSITLSSSAAVPATTQITISVSLINSPVFGNGKDFLTNPAPSNNAITLPVTSTGSSFTISSFIDNQLEPGQAVVFTIEAGTGYKVGAQNSIKISISDCFLSTALVAEYLFTGNANDTSGKNNHGTVNSGATLTTDRSGAANTAYSFDGSSLGSITVPHNNGINFSTSQGFTVSVWAAASDVQNDMAGTINDIMRKWDNDGSGYPFGISYYNSSFTSPKIFTAARYDGSVCGHIPEARSGVVNSSFHHIVFTKFGGQLSIYVDNVLAGSGTDNTSCSTSNTGFLVIGRRGGATPRAFTGKIDDIRIYNNVLTAGEIAYLFAH